MIYLLTGDNTFGIEQQLKKRIAGYDGEVERIDGSELSIERLPDLLSGVTLFSAKRLVVLRNVSQNKLVWAALLDWLERGVENDIVLVEPSPDKRTKTYKWLEKNADVFVAKELQPREALQWVMAEAKQQNIDLTERVAEFFIDYVGNDQWRLSSEMAKLALDTAPPTVERIRELVEPTPQATSFELLDAAFAGRHAEVERLLDTVARQEDPYMFFGLLSGQIYAISLMKTAGDARPDEIAKTTGVHPFVLRKVAGLARQLRLAELRRIIASLADLDAHMKSRPTEPWTQIQAMLLTLKN